VVFASRNVDGTRLHPVEGILDSYVGAAAALVWANRRSGINAYRSSLSFGVFPVISLSQASAHSRTMSIAYLADVSQTTDLNA
jgi:hypothetical protein